MSDTYNQTRTNKTLNIRLGSLNYRTVLKASNEANSDNLIRFLRLQNFDIFACQESHIPINSFNDTIE
jgi:hypothetical protein